MSTSEYEVFQDVDGEYRWRLKAANGEIVAQSEAYSRKQDAERGAADAANASREAMGNGEGAD